MTIGGNKMKLCGIGGLNGGMFSCKPIVHTYSTQRKHAEWSFSSPRATNNDSNNWHSIWNHLIMILKGKLKNWFLIFMSCPTDCLPGWLYLCRTLFANAHNSQYIIIRRRSWEIHERLGYVYAFCHSARWHLLIGFIILLLTVWQTYRRIDDRSKKPYMWGESTQPSPPHRMTIMSHLNKFKIQTMPLG